MTRTSYKEVFGKQPMPKGVEEGSLEEWYDMSDWCLDSKEAAQQKQRKRKRRKR